MPGLRCNVSTINLVGRGAWCARVVLMIRQDMQLPFLATRWGGNGQGHLFIKVDLFVHADVYYGCHGDDVSEAAVTLAGFV